MCSPGQGPVRDTQGEGSGDDSSICQICTTCAVLYICCLTEFSQHTVLGRLFNIAI